MRNLFVLALTAMLFFGCMGIGEEQPPVDEGDDITIIEKNDTVAPPEDNETEDETPDEETPSEDEIPPENEDETPENETSEEPEDISYTKNPDQSFAVYFVYVGTSEDQGDAIFIKKGDVDVLIDSGPEANPEIINFMKSRKIDDIDILVSTHGDPEHYGQMSSIVDQFDVEQFWWNGQYDGNEEYRQLIEKIENKGITTKVVSRGDSIELNGMTFEVWNPSDSSTFTDLDNNAIVLKVTDRNFCAFLTSDIIGGAQNELVNQIDFECAIFQAPYHGLGTGNIQVGQLLGKVNPEVVVVSGGPSETLGGARGPLFSRLDTPPNTIPYYQNYIGGGLTIKIVSDGSTYDIGYIGD